MRGALREGWEIIKGWWAIVTGGVFGGVAILHAIQGAHGKSVWFWGFWAMTALLIASLLRLRRVAQERDKATTALEDENSKEARARRLEALADEAILIKDGEVPAGDQWGTKLKRSMEVVKHWQLRVDAEVRRSATKHMDIWLENPENPMLLQFGTPDEAREFIGFCVAQVRRIAEEVRQS